MGFENFNQILDLNHKRKLFYVSILAIFLAFAELLSISLFIPLIGALIDNEISKSFILIDYISKFTTLNDENYLSKILVLIVLCYLIKFLLVNFVTFYSNTFLFDVQKNLRNRLFQNYLNREYLSFIGDHGSYATRTIIENVNVATIGVLRAYITIFSEVILVTFFVIFLTYLNPKSVIVVSTLFGITSLIYFRILKKKLNTWGDDRNFHGAQTIKTVQEGLKGFKEIKIWNIFNFFFLKFKHHSGLYLKAQKKYTISSSLSQYYFELIAIISLTLFLVSLNSQGLTGSDVIALLGVYGAAAFKILPSFNRVVISINTVKYGNPAVKNIRNNINFETTSIEKNNFNFEKLSKISLKNVNFSYDSKKQIFKDLNVTFEKNNIIGIFGESGSGKTTLVNLLCGLIKLESGSINYNDNSIYENIISYQNRLGVVPQEVFIMDDTLEKNIAIGVEDKNIDKIRLENSLKKANLDKFVSTLPESIETKLGENGVFLSGGQKQRIGIARALYKNPDIIIFDESTSSLDEGTEDEFIKNVLNLRNSALIIFITHKKRLIKFFDNTFLLEGKSLRKISE